MHLFNGVISISDVSFLIFSIMTIVALGYLLGCMLFLMQSAEI